MGGLDATIYKTSDAETYKDFSLSRDETGRVVIQKGDKTIKGLEGKFSRYMEAKAAIDLYIKKQTIKDVVQVLPKV